MSNHQLPISSSTLAQLVEAAPDGLMVLSDDGVIEYVNKSGASLLGGSSRELLGSHFGIPLTENGSAEITIKRTQERGVGTCELRVAPINLDADFGGSIVVSLRDISELKAAQANALDAQRTAELAEQAKTHLLWRTSHELRTPLAALVGFAGLLLETELNSDQEMMLGHISVAGMHLREVIDDVLSTAELEAGNVHLTMTEVEVTVAVQEVVDLIQATANHNLLQVSLSADLGDATCIHADSQRLRQVLLNLMSNAVKYNSYNGTVDVNIHMSGPDFVRISIRDHGAGLNSERLARLFVAFDRLGAEETGVVGTGLGLTVAKALTEAMGGRIGVESDAADGCLFWIDMPKVESGK